MRIEIIKAKCVFTESEIEMVKGIIKMGEKCCQFFDGCCGCPFLIGCDECEACIIKELDEIWKSNQDNCPSEETENQNEED